MPGICLIVVPVFERPAHPETWRTYSGITERCKADRVVASITLSSCFHSLLFGPSHNMYNLAQSIIFLFIAGNRVSASRWWRDTGYDGDLLDDSPEPTATLPPKAPYQHYLSAGTSPLNATLGDGIYHLLAARQVRSSPARRRSY
jgi:hypothetical protein